MTRQTVAEPVPVAERDGEPAPVAVLEVLRATDLPAAKRQMILAAEPLRFDAAQAAVLKPLLRRYIDGNYANEQAEESVAVASAVRKYIGLLNIEELPVVQEMLRADRKAPPSFEMEVTKMIARKLTAVLPEDTRPFEHLGNELIDLVRGYLNARMLPKRYCGAIALDSGLALALLRSQHLGELTDRLRWVRVSWFRTTVARQARILSAEFAGRFPAERCQGACQALAELAAAAEAPLP